jgi:hypothetical protein
MIGHPLQYLTEYLRWASKAQNMGKNIASLALKYRETPFEADYVEIRIAGSFVAHAKVARPTERPARSISLLLAQSVSPSNIVSAGDSAGCDLIYLTLIHMRDHEPSLPQPSCVISQSPWLDWTGSETIGHPNWQSDFMFYYDSSRPVLNRTLRPATGYPRDFRIIRPGCSAAPPSTYILFPG